MGQSLSTKDWIRMLIAFLLGAAVTLLVLQLTSGGNLFQGYFSLSRTYDTTTTTTTTRPPPDDSLSTSLERLSSGIRINKAEDDAAGLAVDEDCNNICERGDTCPSDCS